MAGLVTGDGDIKFKEQIEEVERIVADQDREYILEKYIPGRELTVAVLNGRPLTVTDIVTDDWYNYDAKYKSGGSEHIVPADLSLIHISEPTRLRRIS